MTAADSRLLKPALYREAGTEAAPDRPALLGAACACGYVFFPLQTYGCERCGSRDIRPRVLSGSGRLLASARVHRHAGKTRQAPFTVVAVALDDGPIVRTLAVEDEAALAVGQRMRSLLAPVVDPDGAPCFDLRFAREA